MPSEINKSSESVSEAIVEHLQGTDDHSDWIKGVALSAMLMALLSAIGALLAGITSNDTLMERTEEVLEVAQLANDEIHAEVLRTKHELLASVGKTPDPAEVAKVQDFERDAQDLKLAIQKEKLLERQTSYTHEIFAIGVTLLSIAVTMSGMAIVSSRRGLWYVGVLFGVVGCGFVFLGIFRYF